MKIRLLLRIARDRRRARREDLRCRVPIAAVRIVTVERNVFVLGN